ncbi:WecB/TagA/CpsF family glycosyltransferase [Methylobacterium sp. J-068]|uniref:WecB/TagA/CpsF family glycosyltransferase n=1 Tax=Methylobacterium sp. J-068 TaxID=2836649 RepID=UPI001FB9556E|nr:WecB/TagA/CpsF family glycosyltransferase [Methylobacterium sp. J-068]MCJ2033481.1 WecB/TagA/CpsF family glycosyltransferase [Methylobacterium sp. J-068]
MILSASEPLCDDAGRHAWGHDPEIAHYALGGVPISITDMDGLVAALGRRLRRGPGTPGTFVVFRDAHGVVRAQDDPDVMAAHDAAMLVCADGRPLAWIGRLRGHKAIDQVPGIESVEVVCRAGLAEGWKHFFLGGGPGVAEALAREMARRAPGLAVAGHETLPYRPLDEAESDALHRRIQAAGTQILWIGLSTPKQELFMHRHAPFLPGTIAMGVGAAFDVNLNTIPRAPAAMTRLGLEWFYRLIREPRRLGRRYATVVPRFLSIVARDRGNRAKP